MKFARPVVAQYINRKEGLSTPIHEGDDITTILKNCCAFEGIKFNQSDWKKI